MKTRQINKLTFSIPDFKDGTIGQGTLVIIADTADERLPFALGIVTENMGHKLRVAVIEKNGSFLKEGEVWYQSEDEKATVMLPVKKTRFDQVGRCYPFMANGHLYERTEGSYGTTLDDNRARYEFQEWETVYAIGRDYVRRK